jgi:hypothetical protein
MADKNTVPMKTVWAQEFQATHFKTAIYPILADLRFAALLTDGESVKWSYDADMTSGKLGDDGLYAIAARTITDETLTVDQKPYASFWVGDFQKVQDHRPTQEKWAKKSYNVIINKIDGYILNLARAGAATTLDGADLGGSAGDGMTVTSGNATSVFTAARRLLKNQNVIYDANKAFKNNVKLDSAEKFPIAIIPAELEEQLLLQIGFKDTGMGDETLKQGYMGMLLGFNVVTSNSLPFSFRYTLSVQPTDGKKLYLGSTSTTIGSGTGVALNWVTTIGTTAGNVLSVTGATASVTNLTELLNDPYGTSDAGMYIFTRANLSVAQQRILDNISAVDGVDGSCVITIAGLGRVVVTQDDANGTIDREIVHAIFGTSQSVGMVMQREPEVLMSAGDLIGTSASAGYIGKQVVTRAYYGAKVFKTQTYQLINAKINASAWSAPNQVKL